MGMRFHVQPRCVPAAVAARRLGVTEARFRELADELRDNGFPLPDAVTGNFDLQAIDRYIDRRNVDLLGTNDSSDEGETDNAVFLARIAAMRK
jgi:hypothetical protein